MLYRKIAVPIPQYPGEIPRPRLQSRLSPARNLRDIQAPEPRKQCEAEQWSVE